MMRSTDAKQGKRLPPLQDHSSDAAVAELAISNAAAEPSNPEIIPDSEASQHVMLGRGSRSHTNPGNVVFRDQIVRLRKAEFCATNNRSTKDLIAQQIVAAVFKRKLKFIRQLTENKNITCWVAETEKGIINKTIFQALCERDPDDYKFPAAKKKKKHESQQQDKPRDRKRSPVASRTKSEKSSTTHSDDRRRSKKRRAQEGSRSGRPDPSRKTPRGSEEMTERSSVASSQQQPLASGSHLPSDGLLYPLAAQQQQKRISLANYSTADLLEELQLREREHYAAAGPPFGHLPPIQSLAAQQQQQLHEGTLFSNHHGGLHPLLRVGQPSSSSLNVAPASSAGSNLASSTIDSPVAHHRANEQELSLLQLQQQHQQDSSQQEPEVRKVPTTGERLLELFRHSDQRYRR